jgi:hypothetical protein
MCSSVLFSALTALYKTKASAFDDFEIFDATPLPNDLGVSAVTQPAGGCLLWLQ